MKKLSLVILFAIFSTFAFGQTFSGSLAGLASAGRAKVSIDFSEASIHGMSEEEFQVYEKDWIKDLPLIKRKFIGALSNKLNGAILVGTSVKSDYSINVIVYSISTKGNYVCDVIINVGENEVAKIQGIKADGGTFGSKLNLIKDGAEHTGEQLGKYLVKELRKAKRKK